MQNKITLFNRHSVPFWSHQLLAKWLKTQIKNHRRYQSTMAAADSVLSGYDLTQVKLMQEQCILVDQHDTSVGTASKKQCHLSENINKGMLHRAFSVFLFDSDNRLLLQQRSDAKITFPGHFTNTCCSHPLNRPGEVVETGALGVRTAAQRKLHHELGIQPSQVPIEDFQYLTRIHYRADNSPYDGVWAEHEIDYILFIQKDVTLHVNDNEVKSCQYVSQQQLKTFLAEAKERNIAVSPWFQLISDTFLYTWWNDLQDLDKHKDHTTIHRMINQT